MEQKIKHYLEQENRLDRLGLKKGIKVNFLAQGEYNKNYVVEDSNQKMVFRINYGSQLQLDHQITYEYKALKWLEKSNRTPKPLYLDDSRTYFDQGILMMAFLEGKPLNYKTDLEQAATIFSEIHSMTVDDVGREQFISEKNNLLTSRLKECEHLLIPVLKSPYLSSEVKQILDKAYWNCEKKVSQQRIFDEMALWTVNNTEVNSHNFIIGEEKGWLIDWEKPVLSHPCQDLTQFLASTTTLWRANMRLKEEEKNRFLTSYCVQTSFSKEEIILGIDTYSPFLMLRALGWSAMAFDTYQSDAKALQNQEIFKKVESYMDPYFLRNALAEKVVAR